MVIKRLSELQLWSDNPHDGDVGMLMVDIARFGYNRTIAVWQDNIVMAGNTTFKALKRLFEQDSSKLPPNVEQDDNGDWLIETTDISHLNKQEAIAYGIADNRAHQRGEDDQVKLAELLQQIALDDDKTLLEATGYDGDDLDELLKDLNFKDETIDDQSKGVSIFTDEQIVSHAFEYYRQVGFPYRDLPLFDCMQEINALAKTQTSSLINTVTAYQVADTYNKHRFRASANGMKSPTDAFEIDKDLHKALTFELGAGKISRHYIPMINLVNGTQACSNFRPGFALYFYRKYCNSESVILDTSTGYGGRLVGFMASGCARYIGIDPNVETHQANQLMTDDLGFTDKVELHNVPAEDFDASSIKNACDFSFTSPPYFSKEIYADDDTQSWKRYPSYNEWVNGFLCKMLELQYIALKDQSYSVVNIADVKIKNKTYPLVDSTIEKAKAIGFTYCGQEVFPMQVRMGVNDDNVATEPVLIFKKE